MSSDRGRTFRESAAWVDEAALRVAEGFGTGGRWGAKGMGVENDDLVGGARESKVRIDRIFVK